MKPTLTLLAAFLAGKKMCGRRWETCSSISCRPSFCHSILAVLFLSALELAAADAPKPSVQVTQQLLNSIHVTPKLIRDPFPAYAKKFLPFAMAARMEVTHKGRLWTCWAGEIGRAHV